MLNQHEISDYVYLYLCILPWRIGTLNKFYLSCDSFYLKYVEMFLVTVLRKFDIYLPYVVKFKNYIAIVCILFFEVCRDVLVMIRSNLVTVLTCL